MKAKLPATEVATPSEAQTTREKVWNGSHLELLSKFLKICYILSLCITLSQLLELNFPPMADHSVDKLSLWTSWLFLTIGFSIPLCGHLPFFDGIYAEILLAAMDAFLYGLVLGSAALLQYSSKEVSLAHPLTTLVFGLSGLLLLYIDSVVFCGLIKTTHTTFVI
ncbi:hypothetical protein AAHC03_01834 [Spirometra sp. Aus1]